MKNLYFLRRWAIPALLLVATALGSCGRKTAETKPERRDLTELVFASGMLLPDNEYQLTAQAEGYLLELRIEEGDTIQAGQLVAIIDNPQANVNTRSSSALLQIARANTQPNAPAIKQLEANLAAAQAKLQQDEQQSARYQALLAKNAVAKIEAENAQLAAQTSRANVEAIQQQLQAIRQQSEQQLIAQQASVENNQIAQGNNQLKAPVGGRVYTQKKRRGDYVRRGDVIATIASPSFLYAKLSIDEANMSKIRIGQEVAIQLNPNPDKVYRAHIGEILPSFDDASQSFSCKAFFADSLDFRIARTQLQANIIIGMRKNTLVIPRTFLGYGDKVMIPEGKELKTIVVKPGVRSSEWVEILEGISEGQTIARYL